MDRCALCPRRNNFVPDSGPANSSYLLIGEAPGRQEDKKGTPFIGSTGDELNKGYLPTAGLRREEVRVTNAIHCLPPTTGGRLDPKRKQDLAMLESCASTFLYPLIDRMKPQVIVPMGVFACKAIDTDIQLDLHHGMPMETSFGLTFPMYHPSAGVHEPKKMLQIRTDWVRLKRLGLGILVVPEDEYPTPDYQEATPYDIRSIDPTLPMACDTETSRALGPYVLTYSQVPGTARLIRATDQYLLSEFGDKLQQWEDIILFHNWMYDQRIVKQMGLKFPNRVIRDTMIQAFHLGNIPQGLKALAFRLLGMRMMDFEDLVTPYSTPELLQYYEMASMIDWPRPEEELVRDKAGMWKLYRPQSFTTKIKRFLKDYEGNPHKDLFDTWNKNWADSQAMVEDKIGPWPGLDIAHVPFDEMLHYAARDSDATLRLSYVLDSIKDKAMTGIPQENWL